MSSTPTAAMLAQQSQQQAQQQQVNAGAYGRYGNPMSVQSIPSSPASGPIHSPFPHQQQAAPTPAPPYLNSSINSPIIQSPSMPQQSHHNMNLSMQSPIVQQSYSPMNNNSPMQQQQPPNVSNNSPYQQQPSYPPSVNSPYNPYSYQQGHYHQPPTPIQSQQQMYMANSPFSGGSGPPSYSHSGGSGLNTQPPTPGQISHPHHGMVASPYSNSQVPGSLQQQYSQPPSSYPGHISQQPPHLQHHSSGHHLNHMPHTPQPMGSVNSPMSLKESSMYQQRATPAPIDLELLEQQERERERERERREQERREQEQRQLETLKRQRKEKERERFLVELEFVQSLANPDYVVHLWRQGVFERATFRNYLRYLLYWKEPEYIKFIKYPQCLFFLDLIAGGLNTNTKSIDLEEHIYQVVNALRQNKSSIMDQQIRHWKSNHQSSNSSESTSSSGVNDTKTKSKTAKRSTANY